ncbi:MAG TPA: metallophosphoesterase family protein [Vicinamibacterales bacterium]|jgi:diadenosine tetraphosphatase ApaH/serine/threonine PP2A family protein phosphatase
MRYLLLTDIHANLEAFDTCVAHARARRYERTLVLGDIVGYGPNPNEVIERVKTLGPLEIVRGNHDKVACGIEQPEGFNIVAKSAALWTLDALTPDHRDWLAALPEGPILVDPVIEICHGSPFDEDAYIFDELDVNHALRVSKRPLCLFGHTHSPIVFEQAPGADTVNVITLKHAGEMEILVRDGYKYLLNPGSVGQPRDADPRAAYAIVDTDRRHVELFRLEYPLEETQAKILAAGLPDVLAQRLGVGR